MVAAFGDFDVSRVRWREPEARRVVVGNVARLAGDEVQRLPSVVDECGVRSAECGVRSLGEQTRDDVAGLGDLVQTHEGIDFRQLFGQLGGKALRHAAADDQPLPRPAAREPAVLMRLEDRLDRFLLRGVDERAGVDDEHVGILRGGGDLHAVRAHTAEHDLGIHEIFRATERDHADFFHKGILEARGRGI